jgi:hypothetical protein
MSLFRAYAPIGRNIGQQWSELFGLTLLTLVRLSVSGFRQGLRSKCAGLRPAGWVQMIGMVPLRLGNGFGQLAITVLTA